MRLAILDEDSARSGGMAALLRKAGHGCSEFQEGAALKGVLRHENFDLLLIDADLPGTGPTEMLAWIGKHVAAPPAVILVADAAATPVLKDSLADAIVVKPVDPPALRATVKALLALRQRSADAAMSETYGDHVFDVMAMSVTVGGRPVELTAKEFGLALMLFRNLNRPLSRVQIMEGVWGRVLDASSRTLDAHVSQIRNRLGLRPEYGLRLSSIYSFGYRLDVVDAMIAAG